MPEPLECVRTKNLAGFGGMLGSKCGDVGLGEIADGDRIFLDIERTAGVDGRTVFAVDQVITQIAHTDQCDRGRESADAAAGKAAAQLAQERDHSLSFQHVDFVEQHNQRFGGAERRPIFQQC